MKVVFLDFDGVFLDTHKSIDEAYNKGGVGMFPDGDAVTNLNRVFRETGAKCCVISDWRKGRTIFDLQKLLNECGVECEVIGKTSSTIAQSNRALEIKAFLEYISCYTDEKIESLVIIDDRAFRLDAPMTDHLSEKLMVAPDPAIGLTEEDSNMAINIINNYQNL